MVALHNRRLTQRDIFPDLLWNEAQWHAKRDAFHAQNIAEGMVEPAASFRTARQMEDYARRFPSFRERQKIMASIYRGTRQAPPALLTQEEVAWLQDRLAGVNDPTGQAILDKLDRLQIATPKE